MKLEFLFASQNKLWDHVFITHLAQKRKLCPLETFSVINTAQRGCWHKTVSDRKMGNILGRNENSRLLNQKAEIFWQFEKLRNHKDSYGQPLERDSGGKASSSVPNPSNL